MGVANIKIGKIGTVTPKEEIEVNESARQLNNYKKSLTRLSQVLDTLVNDDAIDYLKLKSVTGNIMENLIGNYQIFFKLAQLKSYDTMTFRHLLNVSILAIYFSHQLGFRKEDCLNIGIGALFHDIGKLYIEKKIIQKPDKLDESEFDKIKNHAAFGAEILLRHIDTLQILPVVVAFEHHLGYDLKGYPKITFFRKPHIASLIIYICDVYDALAQRRTYKRDYPPEMIYAIMVRQKGKKFSPELLDKFFKIMGVWPKGTIVLLSDGRIAIVREENDDIFSPIVEIVSDTSKESINLALKKEVKIQRSLNPFSEGEKYLNFI
jgi:putative nucleotidyltransferase with HDIG domain